MALTQLTKVDGGGISTTSDYRVGIITASKFVGPFDGTGGNFSGVVTATNGVFSGNISAVDGNFSGNVTIGGTLTYEDVTNIDSVGIVTAAKDIHVGAGVSAVGVGTFGSLDIGGDIDVDGHTNLDNVSVSGVSTFSSSVSVSGQLTAGQIASPTKITAGNPTLRLVQNNNSLSNRGYIQFYYNTSNLSARISGKARNSANGQLHFDVEKDSTLTNILLVDDAGVDITGNITATGDLDVDGHTNLDNVSVAGVTTFAGAIDLNADLDVDGHTNLDNISVAGVTTFAGAIDLNADLDVDGHTNLDNISVAGVTTFSNGPVVVNGQYYRGIINSGSQEKIVGGYISGSDTLRLGESMYLTSTGLGIGVASPSRKLDVSGDILGNAFMLKGNTSASPSIQAQMYRPENNTLAFATNGNQERLRIDSAGRVIIANGGNGGTADVNADNFVVKNYESSSSCGISILNADNQNSTLYFGNASDTKHAEVVWSDAANLFLIGTSNAGASIKFRTANQSDALTIDSSGHLLPGAAGAQNLGSTTLEWGNVYIADSKNIFFGSDQDAEIYHNGGSGFYLNNSTGNTYIRGGGGQIMMRPSNSYDAIVAKTNEVELYYNSQNHSTPKLKTSATGITVDGEVAASQEFPDIQPTFDANFAASRTLDPRFTFQRVGPASFVNESGKVVLVGENVPRFDHDLTTRESLGILIEEERTNFMKYSDEFAIASGQTGGNWDSIGGASDYTRVSDTTETKDPTGITNHASKITFVSGNATLRGYWYSGAANGAVAKTFSVYLKRATSNTTTVVIDIGDLNGTSYTLTDEWKRYSVTTSGAGNGNFVDMTLTTGASTPYYAWGGQIEAGAFATSYIPTSSAAVTRGADLLRIMDDEFKDIFGDEFKEFTIVADYDNSDTVDGTVQSLIDFWGETTGYTDRIEIFKDGDSPYNIEVRGIGNNNGLFANGVVNASSKAATQRFATSWSVDYTTNNAANRKWAFSFSGEAVDVIGDLTGTDVPAITRLGLGNTPTRLDLSPGKLHFKRFTFYPKAVSDQQLINLSTP